jgi:hypothetical protein
MFKNNLVLEENLVIITALIDRNVVATALNMTNPVLGRNQAIITALIALIKRNLIKRNLVVERNQILQRKITDYRQKILVLERNVITIVLFERNSAQCLKIQGSDKPSMT